MVILFGLNFSFEVTFSGILGYSRLQAVESTLLISLEIKLCAGLLSRDSIGVFCWCNRAYHWSLLSLRAFLNKDWTIFTADSPFPSSLVM